MFRTCDIIRHRLIRRSPDRSRIGVATIKKKTFASPFSFLFFTVYSLFSSLQNGRRPIPRLFKHVLQEIVPVLAVLQMAFIRQW